MTFFDNVEFLAEVKKKAKNLKICKFYQEKNQQMHEKM